MLADQKTTGYVFSGLSKALAPRERSGAQRPPVVVASVFQTGLNLMRDLEGEGELLAPSALTVILRILASARSMPRRSYVPTPTKDPSPGSRSCWRWHLP